MIAVVDYGVGNLFSVACSLSSLGAEAVVTGDREVIKKCDRIILPGVGAFRDAAAKLQESGLDRIVCDEARTGKPLLGICLGMQLLFNKSYEYGEYDGLSLIDGNIKPIKPIIPTDYKVPHIGWNALNFGSSKPKNPLFKYINEGDFVYFVHSYAAMDCDSSVIATTEYGVPLTAAVTNNNVFGTQFHPEKSGDVGLKILRAFCEM